MNGGAGGGAAAGAPVIGGSAKNSGGGGGGAGRIRINTRTGTATLAGTSLISPALGTTASQGVIKIQ